MVESSAAHTSAGEEKRVGLFARLALFFRQVLAEMKKVQRPTKSELWQIFGTVVLFVALVMLFVGVVDIIFGQLVFWIFG